MAITIAQQLTLTIGRQKLQQIIVMQARDPIRSDSGYRPFAKLRRSGLQRRLLLDRGIPPGDKGKEERRAEPKVNSRLGCRCPHGPTELSLYLIPYLIPYLSMGGDWFHEVLACKLFGIVNIKLKPAFIILKQLSWSILVNPTIKTA